MKISHIEELAKIKDFVRECKKIEDFMGFNVAISKHPGRSYVLAKQYSSPKPLCVLAIQLDYFDPIQHQMVDGAIFEELYGRPMTSEEATASIVSRDDEIWESVNSTSSDFLTSTQRLTH